MVSAKRAQKFRHIRHILITAIISLVTGIIIGVLATGIIIGSNL